MISIGLRPSLFSARVFLLLDVLRYTMYSPCCASRIRVPLVRSSPLPHLLLPWGRPAPRLIGGNRGSLGSGESGGCCSHLPQLAWRQAGLRGIERLARPVLALPSLQYWTPAQGCDLNGHGTGVIWCRCDIGVRATGKGYIHVSFFIPVHYSLVPGRGMQGLYSCPRRPVQARAIY